MEVKVGIRQVQHEVALETDESASEIEQRLTAALESDSLLKLRDDKGRTVLIPAATIAYVDLGVEHPRKVGFGSV